LRKIDIYLPVIGSIIIIALVAIPLVIGTIDNISSYVAGLAALVTSWISLYFSVIRTALRRPVFKVGMDSHTVVFDPKVGQKTYLRLKVTNIGQSPAKNCVGRLLEVRHADGTFFDFDPFYFFWARQDDIVADFSPVIIYTGDTEYFDVISITHKEKTFKFRVSSRKLTIHTGNKFPVESVYLKIAIYADDMLPYQAWYRVIMNPKSLKEAHLEKVKEPNMTGKKRTTKLVQA